MRISDWSSDVCSSDLAFGDDRMRLPRAEAPVHEAHRFADALVGARHPRHHHHQPPPVLFGRSGDAVARFLGVAGLEPVGALDAAERSEERRVGKGCVSTCRTRWSPDYSKQNKKIRENSMKQKNEYQ